MPKCFLWNQLTVFSEANPLQIKLEHKATGKIMDMNLDMAFSPPSILTEEKNKIPNAQRKSGNPPGRPLAYLAFVPSLRLWKAQLHCDGHEPPAHGSPPSVKQQSKLTTIHMATCAWEGHLGTGQRGGFRLLFYPLTAHILLTAFRFQPHCDLPALAESIR